MMDKQPAEMGGDDAAYEALANEMADETSGRDDGPAPAEAKTETKDAKAEDGEPKPEPLPYEELEKRYRQQGGALKEARERERQFADQLKSYNTAIEEMRAARQAARPAEPKPEPVKEIDPYEDPIGYVQAEMAKMRAELQTTHQTAQEVREAETARQQYSQFMSVVEKAESAFAANVPDYHDAAAFLEQSRRTELATLYPDSPQMDNYARQNGYQSAAHLREAIFRNDAQTVAQTALQIGQNPAEAYYNLAKGRGYTVKPAGDTPAKRAEAAIDAVRRGQNASKTISGGSGGADKAVGVKDLAELYADDPEEFDRQWDKLARAGKLG